jgi:hypothetical protein
MRRLAFAALAAWPLFFYACGSDTPAPVDPADAAPDITVEASSDSDTPDPPDVIRTACQLDDGSDPVSLCTQKRILRYMKEAAVSSSGVASSWDYKNAVPNPAPRTVQDEIAYAASVANYLFSSAVYGDNVLTGGLEVELSALSKSIVQKLATLPATYEGVLYWRLRAIATRLRFIDRNADAIAVDARADAYALQIDSKYTRSTADAGPATVVLGEAQGDKTAYVTADAATGALALLDMAARVRSDAVLSRRLQLNAKAAFDYLYRRARHPGTKLYFRALVTSTDPNHDTLQPSSPTGDALFTEVNAAMSLALGRADALKIANASWFEGELTNYAFQLHGTEILDALIDQISLWDRGPGGYMEAYLPAQNQYVANKPTRANALLFAATRRSAVQAGRHGIQSTRLKPMLIVVQPLHSTLMSIVDNQQAYFRAASPSFDFALQTAIQDAGSSDAAIEGGDAEAGPVDAGPLEANATHYTTEAIASVLEAMHEQWLGRRAF